MLCSLHYLQSHSKLIIIQTFIISVARVAFSFRQPTDSVVYSKRPRPEAIDRFISDAVCGRLTRVLSDYLLFSLEKVRNSEDAEHLLQAYLNDLVLYVLMEVQNYCELVDYGRVVTNARSSYSYGKLCYHIGHFNATQLRYP